MGAYGAALHALSKRKSGRSTLLSAEELKDFSSETTDAQCGLCQNNCRLTISRFSNGKRLIGGNRCERPVTHKVPDQSLNLVTQKLDLVYDTPSVAGAKKRVGIPMGLNMLELYPFWRAFFAALNMQTVPSPRSSRELYVSGQDSIPSDTVCYPAKLMHGHIAALKQQNVDFIFYPCMSYNLDEHTGDNHYNCPVVAYYPEVVSQMNTGVPLVFDYIGLHRPDDFAFNIRRILQPVCGNLSLSDAKRATEAAFEAYEAHLSVIRMRAQAIIAKARAQHKRIFVLAGRPYHIDPEVNHGIDQLCRALDAAVITEDSISHLSVPGELHVLNQWTYHSRLYSAARYVCTQSDMELVQLVSFGCGVDAITTDQVRDILHSANKLYTQVKIDEITNLGAVKIRLRSLLAALEDGEGSETRELSPV